jgi:hypothetical protein
MRKFEVTLSCTVFVNDGIPEDELEDVIEYKVADKVSSGPEMFTIEDYTENNKDA